jgi:hypothetical protein
MGRAAFPIPTAVIPIFTLTSASLFIVPIFPQFFRTTRAASKIAQSDQYID